jgi:hypothetical protein
VQQRTRTTPRCRVRRMRCHHGPTLHFPSCATERSEKVGEATIGSHIAALPRWARGIKKIAQCGFPGGLAGKFKQCDQLLKVPWLARPHVLGPRGLDQFPRSRNCIECLGFIQAHAQFPLAVPGISRGPCLIVVCFHARTERGGKLFSALVTNSPSLFDNAPKRIRIAGPESTHATARGGLELRRMLSVVR